MQQQRALNIPDVTEGNNNKNITKQVIYNEHNKEVKALLAGKEKVRDIWEGHRTKRNYLTRMNMNMMQECGSETEVK